ncbi:MAG TPA: type II secretion system F family protein [Jatrophihabitans sp.]|jgi:type IV pilus assembly protein PilC|uniref:type II secretion system F family protein n=1 Tax=Jatrophihabitans sp. TaxID=1932789 RepID=UPI002E0681BC|nr:type II secretion system F family protein [Jatrophihabitans sp.]
MPKFAYVATAPDGLQAKGVEKADSRSAAELALYDRELRDIRVTEKKSILQLEISGPRVKREDLMHLSRQMAAFVRAGLPILDAVHTIAQETENSSVRVVMEDIEESLRSGERFSDCLDRHAKIFPDFYRGIVRSAELTGELDVVLTRLAVYIERDLEARRKIQAATIYPAVIMVMSIVTITVLAGFVLPKFKVFFKSLDAKLPLPTRMLLAVTDFLTSWWWALLVGVGVIVLSIGVALRTETGRYTKDRILLKTPVLGTTIQYALVERFCRILASMVNAGVNLPEALRVSTESLRNRVYIRALSSVNEAMLEGQGIATPLARTQMFPNTAVQMLRVGEDTGTLDAQLEVTAQYYETELDYKIKKLTSLFEPAIIVVMGLLVGFVAVALVSAMYGVFHQVKV